MTFKLTPHPDNKEVYLNIQESVFRNVDRLIHAIFEVDPKDQDRYEELLNRSTILTVVRDGCYDMRSFEVQAEGKGETLIDAAMIDATMFEPYLVGCRLIAYPKDS